ncbi:hypothetical protein GGER_30080 [Serratia rubidaea]
MPHTEIFPSATSDSWTEAEIRQQPASWLRALERLDDLRRPLEQFLAPLLLDGDLRIVLTGAGTSAFIGEIIAPGWRGIRAKISARCPPLIWSPTRRTT